MKAAALALIGVLLPALTLFGGGDFQVIHEFDGPLIPAGGLLRGLKAGETAGNPGLDFSFPLADEEDISCYLPAGGAWSGEGVGTETYILIANPGNDDSLVAVRFFDETGPAGWFEQTVPARARRTVKLGDHVQSEGAISTAVTSLNNVPVFCERSTYFSLGDIPWTASHGSPGTPRLAEELYFAEGATHLFDYFIILFNPGEEVAEVRLIFFSHSGEEWAEEVEVPALANRRIFVNDIVGDPQPQLAARIESSRPVAAERTIFWPRIQEGGSGGAAGEINDCHAAAAAPILSDRWAFAEGATHLFDYYLALANFNDETVPVDLIFSGPAGEPVLHSLQIGPRSRSTVKVNDFLQSGQVAVLVEASHEIYAERSMYWSNPLGIWGGGHSGAGSPAAGGEGPAYASRWVVPEGATHVFDSYILFFNPEEEREVSAEVAFLGKDGPLPADASFNIPPRSRRTLNLRETAGSLDQVATVVTADGPVTVDRAMYFSRFDRPDSLWRTGHSGSALPIPTPTPVDPDSAVGWAVGNRTEGYGMILHTTDGGQTWVRQGEAGQIPDVDFISVQAVDENNVWLLGYLDGGYPTVMRTTDGGQTWTRKGSAQTIPNVEFGKISALDNDTAWAVGYGGTIAKTSDGGQTWIEKNDANVPAVPLQAVYALNEQIIWAGGEEEGGYTTIVKSTDGGQSWSRMGEAGPDLPDKHLIDIYALDENVVWAAGQHYTIVKSIDGGQSWINQGVAGTIMDCNGIFPLDSSTAWIAQDYGNILRTDDGGSNWINQSVPSEIHGQFLLRPRALDAVTCWITGQTAVGSPEGSILRTTDGGANWNIQTLVEGTGLWGLTFVGVR